MLFVVARPNLSLDLAPPPPRPIGGPICAAYVEYKDDGTIQNTPHY